MPTLNDELIAAIRKQGHLISATQTMISDTTKLAHLSRSKRTVDIKLNLIPGEHPHGPSYYSAKTLTGELNDIDSNITAQEHLLQDLRHQCNAQQAVKQKLLSKILEEATQASLLAADTYPDGCLNPPNPTRSPASNTPPPPKTKLSNLPINNLRTALLCYQIHLRQQRRLKQLQDAVGSPRLPPRLTKPFIGDTNGGTGLNTSLDAGLDTGLDTGLDLDPTHKTEIERKSILSWEKVQTTLEIQRQDDRQGLWTLGLASNRIAQQAKMGLVKTKANLKNKRRRRSVMLRGVASSSTVPSPRNTVSGAPGDFEEEELSVSAAWLTRANSHHVRRHDNDTDSDVGAPFPTRSGFAQDNVSEFEKTHKPNSNPTNSRSGSPVPDAPVIRGPHVPTQWLKMIFNRMDKDRSGDVDRSEFIEGMRSDPDMLQLFKMNQVDSDKTTLPSFKDIFDSISDDGSVEISFEEFAAFFESRQDGYFHAGDKIDALYGPEGIWYVAKVIKVLKPGEEIDNVASSGGGGDDRRGSGIVAALKTAYMVRYTEYPEEGPFHVAMTDVRARFKTDERVRVIIGDHNFLEQGKPATVKRQTKNGYLVELVDTKEEHSVFASDVFPEKSSSTSTSSTKMVPKINE